MAAAAQNCQGKLVTMNIAAMTPVTRVSRLAVPRVVMNPPPPLHDAEPTALAALDQHDANQRERDHDVDGQENGRHRASSTAGSGQNESRPGGRPGCAVM